MSQDEFRQFLRGTKVVEHSVVRRYDCSVAMPDSTTVEAHCWLTTDLGEVSDREQVFQ